ncbi:hypothetical protein THS27_13440 [Thalassospira sp. MCCC 1A01428]|nr:hypothetical protein THS27_13440 [Thalassospira sp. MCCC 1A01428]
MEKSFCIVRCLTYDLPGYQQKQCQFWQADYAALEMFADVPVLREQAKYRSVAKRCKTAIGSGGWIKRGRG